MATNNPYQTPQGQLEVDDDLAYGEIKFFSPSSRINRLRYWAHSMLFMLGAYVLLGLGGVLATMVSLTVGLIIMVPVYIAMIVFSFILIIQRLHDLNKTGWMSLLMLIPFANLYLLVLVIFFKGTPGRNNYGLQTPPNKTWHWVLALVVPIVFIGIIAAVAIPAYNAYVQQMSHQMEDYAPDAEYPSSEYQQPAVPAPENNSFDQQNNYDQQQPVEQNTTEQSNYAEPSYTEPNNDNGYQREDENDEPYQEEQSPEAQYQEPPEPDYGPVEEASTYEQATEQQQYNDTYVDEYGERSQYEHIPSEDRIVTE